MKAKISYLKGIVICHGKSEKVMCEFIRSNLRIQIEVDSDKKGKKSIQITSLMKFLKGEKYESIASFKRQFDNIEPMKEKRELPQNFKVFIIMDTDDCTQAQKKAFKDKSMFKEHWLFDYIVPIYNDNNLEEVLIDAGIKFKKTGNEMKKEYPKIFPINGISDISGIKEFKKNLEKSKKTNMEEFVAFCLELLEK